MPINKLLYKIALSAAGPDPPFGIAAVVAGQGLAEGIVVDFNRFHRRYSLLLEYL
jgi:hypothetical protein